MKHSNSKNGFLTMDSFDLYISITIFSFQIGWAESKLFWFEYFGRQPNWKLKGHNWSDQKSQNGFFSHAFPLAHRTHVNWRNWISMSRTHFYQLSKTHHLSVIKEGEESQEDTLKIRSDEKFPEYWLDVLRSFLLDFHFSCDSELSKCLNWQTWQTGWRRS